MECRLCHISPVYAHAVLEPVVHGSYTAQQLYYDREYPSMGVNDRKRPPGDFPSALNFLVQAKNQSRFFVFDAQTCLFVSCRPWLWHKRDKMSYNRDRADEKRVWFWSWWWEDLRRSYTGETSLQLVWRHFWDGFNTWANRLDTFPHGPETFHRRSEPAVWQMVFVHQFTVVRRSWVLWSGHILILKKVWHHLLFSLPIYDSHSILVLKNMPPKNPCMIPVTFSYKHILSST